MSKTLPAALVGLTVLVSTAMVHMAFAVWWLADSLFTMRPPAFDWSASIAVSALATAVVLLVVLIVQRLVDGTLDGPTGDAVEATARPSPPVSVVAARRPVTSA